MSGNAHGRQGEFHARSEGDRATITQRFAVEDEGIRRIELESRARCVGEVTSTTEVVGVQVSVEDVGDGPTMLRGDVLIFLNHEGGVDDDTVGTCADDVRETSLPRRRSCMTVAPPN